MPIFRIIPPRVWLGCLFVLAGLGQALAHDWPRFLGPNANGVYRDSAPLRKEWPASGPPVLWRASVGEGYSSPVVSAGKLILFQRQGDEEVVQCVDAASGRELWSGAYPTSYRDTMGHNSGPRATPAIHKGRVFTFGAEGMLTGWDLKNGHRIWQVDTRARYGSDPGFFGMACSPMVESGAIILNIGGRDGAGIVGFDAATGKELWKAGKDEASYSSPTAAIINGKRYALIMTREGLTTLDPSTGSVYFEYPWRPGINASVNAAVPLVIHDRIFLSVSYDTGAVLLQFHEKKPTAIWSGDHILSNHYATSVHHEGHLYGFDGRQERGCNLRCVDLETGSVRWSKDRFGAGTLLIANGSLLILTERGELIQAPASPNSFKVQNRAQLLGFNTRAHAALANRLYYARDNRQLICVDLRPTP